MCLVLIAHRFLPEYPLLVLANRDEFFARPTASAAYWPETPGLLAGRDLQAGGTWMGVRKKRWAAVTNVREGMTDQTAGRSRGWLVRDYLQEESSPPDFLAALENTANDYAGFNLLIGENDDLWYFSNRGGDPMCLEPGLYGLSNALIDTPWPKVVRAKRAFRDWLNAEPASIKGALDLMVDPTRATDEDLPATGIPLHWEQALSAIFIRTEVYGTRSTTLLLRTPDGRSELVERVFEPGSRTYRQHCFAWH